MLLATLTRRLSFEPGTRPGGRDAADGWWRWRSTLARMGGEPRVDFGLVSRGQDKMGLTGEGTRWLERLKVGLGRTVGGEGSLRGPCSRHRRETGRAAGGAELGLVGPPTISQRELRRCAGGYWATASSFRFLTHGHGPEKLRRPVGPHYPHAGKPGYRFCLVSCVTPWMLPTFVLNFLHIELFTDKDERLRWSWAVHLVSGSLLICGALFDTRGGSSTAIFHVKTWHGIFSKIYCRKVF